MLVHARVVARLMALALVVLVMIALVVMAQTPPTTIAPNMASRVRFRKPVTRPVGER